MNHTEALKHIEANSALLSSLQGDKNYRYELRIAYQHRIFFLIVYEDGGFDVFFPTYSIEIEPTMEQFDALNPRAEKKKHHAVEAIEKLRGIEAWIEDRKMKEFFQSTVYAVLDEEKKKKKP